MLKKSTGPDGGWFVTCDGCGKEILAQVFPDRVVVMDKRHGCRHIAVIPRCELLKIMGACEQYSAGVSETASPPSADERADCTGDQAASTR